MTDTPDPRVKTAARAVEDAMLRQGKSPDAHDLARAALKAADTAAWQPIESAPKDVPLAVCIDNSISGGGPFIASRRNGTWCDEYDLVEPTHWMPLLLPPEPKL